MMREHTCLNGEIVMIERGDVWSENDGYGIPLALVCSKCRAEKLSHYRSDIQERYETDEQIEPDGDDLLSDADVDSSWENDCYEPDFDC
jgi:hypothetical protein